MRTHSTIAVASVLVGNVLMATGQDATAQEPVTLSIAVGSAGDLDALRQWDATVDGMARSGDLAIVSRQGDVSVGDREHEYLAQQYAGIPVFGGGVSRQLGGGVTVSLFGTLHPEVGVDTTPALSGPSGPEIAALLERMHGREIIAGAQRSLGVLPLPDGSYALAYRVAMSGKYFYFADARGGRLLHRVHALMSQSAIGPE